MANCESSNKSLLIYPGRMFCVWMEDGWHRCLIILQLCEFVYKQFSDV